jgi:hypothetical protein
MNLDVVARQLDIARPQIQPSLDATTHTFSPQSLQDIPQGANASLDQILLQAPGVAQDRFGQVHVRGEHANVQYRLNGVELPEGSTSRRSSVRVGSFCTIDRLTPPQVGSARPLGIVLVQARRPLCTCASTEKSVG